MSCFDIKYSSCLAPPTRAGRPCQGGRRSGFTLIELLVVIGIIVILIAILLPAAAAVRKRAYATSTSQEISSIASACQAYYQDYRAYPGPVAENDIDGLNTPPVAGTPTPITALVAGTPTPFALTDGNGTAVTKVTSSENLVLGLTGGLNLTFSATPAVTAFKYNASIITNASGPQSLNTLINSQKQTFAYYSPKPEELTTPDTTAGANYVKFGATSVVPEYLDHIPGNVVGSTSAGFNYGPILYFRARVGAVNGVNTGAASVTYQYNTVQATPYGPTAAAMSTDFTNPNLSGQPIGRDAFILISAGSDRVFGINPATGTTDDIIYGN